VPLALALLVAVDLPLADVVPCPLAVADAMPRAAPVAAVVPVPEAIARQPVKPVAAVVPVPDAVAADVSVMSGNIGPENVSAPNGSAPKPHESGAKSGGVVAANVKPSPVASADDFALTSAPAEQLPVPLAVAAAA